MSTANRITISTPNLDKTITTSTSKNSNQIEVASGDGVATTAYVDIGLNLKADKTYVDAELREKVQNFKIKNEIVNSDFSQGTADWVLWGNASLASDRRFFKISDGKILLDGTTTGNGRIGQDVVANIYDKFYLKAEVLGDHSNASVNMFVLMDFGSTTNLEGHLISSRFKTENPNYSTTFINPKNNGFRLDMRYSAGDSYINRTIDNLLLINLTQTFGAGNEPTKEEMDKLVESVPNQWWDGELALAQKQIVDWLLTLERGKVQKLKIKNEIVNGDFSDGLTGWLSTNSENSINGNRLINTGDGTSRQPQVRTPANRISGNKYYQFVKIKPLSDLVVSIVFIGFTQSVTFPAPTPNVEKFYSGISTSGSTGTTSFVIRHSYDSESTSAIEISYVGVIDLTTTFGAGNEPTKEEMDMLVEMIPNGWWDGELPLEQKEVVQWLLNLKSGLSEIGARLDSTDSQRQQDQLKVAKVEKKLDDYKLTIANVNVNQETKQSVTGYGVVSLPKNSANGRVSANVKGETRTNLVDNGLNYEKWTTQNGISSSNGLVFTKGTTGHLNGSCSINLKPNTLYTLVVFVSKNDASSLRQLTILSGDGRIITDHVTGVPAEVGINKKTFTTRSDLVGDGILFLYYSTTYFKEGGQLIYKVNVLEGDWTTGELANIPLNHLGFGTKSTVSAIRLKSVGRNLFDQEFVLGTIGPTTGVPMETTTNVRSGLVRVKPNTQYSHSYMNGYVNHNRFFYDINKNFISSGLLSTTPSNAYYIRHIFRKSDSSVLNSSDIYNLRTSFQLEEGTVATPYEPYTESTQYLPNVGELRSLPNGTKDEIRVSGSKAELIKRVSDEVILDGSEDWTVGSGTLTETVSFKIPLSNLRDNGAISSNFAKYVSSGISTNDTELLMALSGYVYIRILKIKLVDQRVTGFKAWLQTNPITLTYQLAEPIITPINVSGTLLSNPSGTVYVENVVADAGIYTTKFDIKELQLPIKSIDKLIKYDFTTGMQTVLDTSLAVINEDNKSFTHPNLTDKDMVFVDYFYDVEGTLGETTIEYLDSRHTVKDTTNNKFYSWDIKSTNGVPTVELTEVL